MIYLSSQDIVLMHDFMIEHRWWLSGNNNIGQLESVLSHIKNDIYYPDMLEKITHLFFSLVQFHMFNDGNKRTAIVASETFLFINNYVIEDFIIKMEDIAVWVAKWEIDKWTLEKIFSSMFISFWYLK